MDRLRWIFLKNTYHHIGHIQYVYQQQQVSTIGRYDDTIGIPTTLTTDSSQQIHSSCLEIVWNTAVKKDTIGNPLGWQKKKTKDWGMDRKRCKMLHLRLPHPQHQLLNEIYRHNGSRIHLFEDCLGLLCPTLVGGAVVHVPLSVHLPYVQFSML